MELVVYAWAIYCICVCLKSNDNFCPDSQNGKLGVCKMNLINDLKINVMLIMYVEHDEHFFSKL